MFCENQRRVIDPVQDSKSKVVSGELKKLVEKLPAELATLSAPKRKRLRLEIEAAIESLREILQQIDPIKQPPFVFDPTAPQVIGELIAHTLLVQPIQLMSDVEQFYGSGVYAIYYGGDFPAYQPIKNTDNPIYVGKADPEELHAKSVEEQGRGLAGRLKTHRSTISQASNLNLAHFSCRFLVVKSAWQETAENYLINRFKPIWNKEMNICQGFGKHGDKASTRSNKRSAWDTLHPGRAWATEDGNIANKRSADEIIQRISEHFEKYPPVKRISERAGDKT